MALCGVMLSFLLPAPASGEEQRILPKVDNLWRVATGVSALSRANGDRMRVSTRMRGVGVGVRP